MPLIGNIGPGELILLLVIILVVFGPGRLPEIGSAVGKGIREFRKAATEVTDATRIDAPPATTTATPPTPPAEPAAAAPLSPAAEDERRRYEELKALFEPAASSAAKADESHGDAGRPSA